MKRFLPSYLRNTQKAERKRQKSHISATPKINMLTYFDENKRKRAARGRGKKKASVHIIEYHSHYSHHLHVIVVLHRESESESEPCTQCSVLDCIGVESLVVVLPLLHRRRRHILFCSPRLCLSMCVHCTMYNS